MQGLLTWLGELPPLAVYLVAALVVFAETGLIIGLVLPGEITLLFVGFLAYAGTLRLPTAIVVMVLAALAGDAVAYLEGRRAGPRLRASRLGRWVGERRWAKADALFARHGGRAVGLGRFIAFARTLTPRLAGMSGVAYRWVLPWNLFGVVSVVGGSVVLGYLAGTSYARLADVFGRATGALLLFVLVIVALVVVARYVGRHRHPVTAFGARLVHTPPLRWLEHRYLAGFRWLTARFGSDGAVAVNVALGVPALLGVGLGLTWAVDRLVRHSGFPLVDPMVAEWLAARRTPAVMDAALTALTLLRGSFLVLVVAAVGVALNPRPRAWRNDLLGALTTVGAPVSLLVLALAADWARPAGVADAFFPNQVTLVTASLGMLAWMLGRRLPWGASVAAWTAAVGGVILVGAARLYLGRDWPSEVFASALLGALWVLLFVVAWRTRERLPAGGVAPGDLAASPSGPAGTAS
ncbi:MAG TPA: VTT domain-containing protein [Micromonosporaceae bacterium]|nr:VTT domain-containing protein [Micromonosporaceae bacterium]